MDRKERAAFIAAQIKERISVLPKVGVVLGSGWNGVADLLKDKKTVAYAELAEMPRCGVQGHMGNFVFGRAGANSVVAMQGRFHLYEGKGTETVVLPVEVMKELGVETLVLTNAAGGVNGGVRPGELMVISDHINLTGRNPLEGVAASEIKPVFIDMSDAYDAKLREKFVAEAAKTGVTVHSGVYAQMLGPSYETPAEIRMLGKMGADAVGMSTAVEAIYARYLKMRVFAVSCISNMAAGICAEKLRHEDVLAVLKERQQLFSRLMYGFISSL